MGWPVATVSLSGAHFLETPGWVSRQAGSGEDGELPGQTAKFCVPGICIWGRESLHGSSTSIVAEHNAPSD